MLEFAGFRARLCRTLLTQMLEFVIPLGQSLDREVPVAGAIHCEWCRRGIRTLAAGVKTRGPDIGEAAPNLRVSSGLWPKADTEKGCPGFSPWALPLLGPTRTLLIQSPPAG